MSNENHNPIPPVSPTSHSRLQIIYLAITVILILAIISVGYLLYSQIKNASVAGDLPAEMPTDMTSEPDGDGTLQMASEEEQLSPEERQASLEAYAAQIEAEQADEPALTPEERQASLEAYAAQIEAGQTVEVTAEDQTATSGTVVEQ